MTKLLRFHDLVAMGVVANRTTLARWIRIAGFPCPISIGPNSLAWDAADVQKWIDARRSRAPAPAEAA